MTKIKIEIKSVWGAILFEYEAENNTIKETLEKAIKTGANLESANLRSANLFGANLESANLFGANLRSANLRSANLESANLESANLFGANLRSANFESANLRSANLESANLFGANLESANLRSANLESANLESANLESAFIPIHCKWSVSLKDNLIVIGCKQKTMEEWDLWFDGIEEFSTKRGTKEFAKIQAQYLAIRAYVIHMKQFDNK